MSESEPTLWLQLLGVLAIPAYLCLTAWVLKRSWRPSWAARHTALHLALWSAVFALFCVPTPVFAGHGAVGLLPLVLLLLLMLAMPGEVGILLAFLKLSLPLGLFAGLALRVLLPQLGPFLVWLLELHPPAEPAAVPRRSRAFSIAAACSAALLVGVAIAAHVAQRQERTRWQMEDDPAYRGLSTMPPQVVAPGPQFPVQVLSPQLDFAISAPQAATPESEAQR